MRTYRLAILASAVLMMASGCGGSSPAAPQNQPTASTLTVTYTGDALLSMGAAHHAGTDTFGPQADCQATATWTQCPDSDFESYTLFRSTSPSISGNTGQATILATYNQSGETTHIDDSPSWETTYYYALRTTNQTSNTAWSNEVSITTPSEPDENTLNVGGETYGLVTLYSDYYGQNSMGAHNTDFFIESDTTAALWHGVYLEMFFPGEPVSSGTYTYTDDDWDSAPAYTFTGNSYVIVGYDPQTGTAQGNWDMASGTVDITVSGSTITITGEVGLSGSGGTATFNYTGSMTDTDGNNDPAEAQFAVAEHRSKNRMLLRD